LAPDAAVRALTLSPAEIFGVSDRLGSIEPGKMANLVLTDGDLFSEKTKIKMVFVDGQRFDIREPEKPRETPKEGVKPGAPPSASADPDEVTGGGL
jgi:adenine deaminase